MKEIEKQMEAKEKEKIAEIISIYLPGAEHLEESIKEAAHKIQALYSRYSSPEEVKKCNEEFNEIRTAIEEAFYDNFIDPSAPIICPECLGSGYSGQQWPEYGMTDDGRRIPLGMNRVICPKCNGHGKLMKDCERPTLKVSDPNTWNCKYYKLKEADCNCDCQDGLIPVTQQDLIAGAWEEK